MDGREWTPSSAYGRQHSQAPGMMHHGSLPGPGPAVHEPRVPVLPPESLKKKIFTQETDIERLTHENKRLAESNVAMRQELLATQKELQMLQIHLKSIHTESDIQLRGLLEKIREMEADIYAGDVVRKELQQAHLEAQSLITARQEVTAEMQLVTEELHKTSSEIKKLPELHSELDSLKQEHQSLRSTFEYEKGLNIDLVERMRGMETNLISMAREVDRLRAEVIKAKQKINAPSNYGVMHPHLVQASGYEDNQYGGTYLHAPQTVGYADSKGVSYANGVYGTNAIHVDPGFDNAHCSEACGRESHADVTSGAPSVQAPDLNSSMSSASGGMNSGP